MSYIQLNSSINKWNNTRAYCQVEIFSFILCIYMPWLLLWLTIQYSRSVFWGLCTETLQTDILAKADHLKELESVIKHAEAFELAQCNQTWLQSDAKVMAAQASNYQRQKKVTHIDKLTHPCQGCSSLQHGQGAKDCSTQCPAWGKICYCKNKNHFATVCCKRNHTVNALIADMTYQSETDSYTSASNNNFRRLLFLFNLYYHIKTYLLSASKSSQKHMFSRHWTYLTAAFITIRLSSMSKKGYSCKRFHSFAKRMVTNVFYN